MQHLYFPFSCEEDAFLRRRLSNNPHKLYMDGISSSKTWRVDEKKNRMQMKELMATPLKYVLYMLTSCNCKPGLLQVIYKLLTYNSAYRFRAR